MRVLFLVLFFFSPFSLSLPLPKKNLILAQGETLFNEEELIGIEGSDEDLENDFDAFEGEDTNFDEEDFEVVGDDEEEEEDKIVEKKDTEGFEFEEEADAEGAFVEGDTEDFEPEGEAAEGAFVEGDTEGFEPEGEADAEGEFVEGGTEVEPGDEADIGEEFVEGDTEGFELIEDGDEEGEYVEVDDEEKEEKFVEDGDEETEPVKEADAEEFDEAYAEMADFDSEDYEIISDRPGYEIVSDEELEKQFEAGIEEEEEGFVLDTEQEPGDSDKSPEALDSFLTGEEEEGEFQAEEGIEELAVDPLEEDPSATSLVAEEEDPAMEEALNLISNIRYLADEDQIVIDCSEPSSYQVRKNEETNQFIIEILQAKLADNLHWPYVLRDFETKFGLIKADQKDSNTVRIIVQLKEEASDFPKSTLTENGDQILIGYGEVLGYKIVKQGEGIPSSPILPAKTLEELYFGDIEFSGTPISIHVIDAPAKQVLRFISEESGLNMVIGESVTGSVTLKLEDVPWDQALYTIRSSLWVTQEMEM